MQNIDNLALLVSIRIFFINIFNGIFREVEGPGWLNELGYKKGALDSQLQVIKFTSCLPTVSGSLRVLRLPQPLKLMDMV